MNAIISMDKHKAVVVDNVHAEMLQTAHEIFAPMLAQLWEKMGETWSVPESWTTGRIVPLHEKD